MIAERTGIGRRGEVAGEESYPNRNPATQLPSPSAYVDKVFDLRQHTIQF